MTFTVVHLNMPFQMGFFCKRVQLFTTYQLAQHVALSLCDSRASCTIIADLGRILEAGVSVNSYTFLWVFVFVRPLLRPCRSPLFVVLDSVNFYLHG